MRRVRWIAISVLATSASAFALGSGTPARRGGSKAEPWEQPAQARPMRYVAVPIGDPLLGCRGSVLDTPYMAPSTGHWTVPGELPPPTVQNFRSVGLDKDD